MMDREFLQCCRAIGKRVPGWTQGPGGNVSYKDGDTLFIKASGCRLDQVDENAGVARVALAGFRDECARIRAGSADCELDYARGISRYSQAGFPRASMETGFHALLPQRYVIHFHSIVALLMAHHRFQPADWQFIPACMPGWRLTQAIVDKPVSSIYLLQNHGVVLASNDCSILPEWEALEESFCRDFGYPEAVAYTQPVGWEIALPTCPMRIYFPDTAVFLERLQRVLQPLGEGYQLTADAADLDGDVAEIWRSTQMLYALCPELAELPEDISGVVASLPNEKFRRGVEEG